MRLFVALNIPADVRNSLLVFQEELRRARGDVTWVGAQNLHLTLKFVGEAEDGAADAIAANISKCLAAYKPFTVSLTGTGLFPHSNSPKVIWVAVHDRADTVTRLATELDEALATMGFAKEKREFVPHLTVGRFRSPRYKEPLIKRIIQNERRHFGSFEVTSVEVMRSILHPQGPEYLCLNSVCI